MGLFLRIVNPTECPIEGFTVLGVSTSRGEEALIGEFGSGNKHAVNVCLRQGINPTIYCGTKRLQFFTQPEEMGDKTYSRVFVKIANRRPQALSMAAEYGEKDWSSVHMALREFVSNAIDAAGGTTKGVIVDIVEESKLSARPGKTVVGIPLLPEVQKWYQELHNYFLQFRKDWKKQQKKRVVEKEKPDQFACYRKGVLVRAGNTDEAPSLFDYNMRDELDIDEARNLSETSIRENVAKVVATDKKVLTRIFQELPQHTSFWERDLPEWPLAYRASTNASIWKEAWKNVWGKAVITSGPAIVFGEMATRKGFQVIAIREDAWYKALKNAGVPDIFSVVDNINEKGHVLSEPTEEDRKLLNRVWDWCVLAELHRNKECPPLKRFEVPMDAEGLTGGYLIGGVVHIHKEHRANPQTYLEEIAHWITGSRDYSRDFQDWAFKMATNMALLAGG